MPTHELRHGQRAATDLYQARLGEIRKQIRTLVGSLERHENRQKEDPENWAFVADLSGVIERLNNSMEDLER